MPLHPVTRHAASLTIAAALTACSNGPDVDGTYVLTKGPISWPPVTATLAKGKFTISEGASGDYTVGDGKVMLTGMTFNDVMQISGNKLVGAKFELVRTHKAPATWAQDCSNVTDAGDNAACLEVKNGVDAERARRQAAIDRSNGGASWSF